MLCTQRAKGSFSMIDDLLYELRTKTQGDQPPFEVRPRGLVACQIFLPFDRRRMQTAAKTDSDWSAQTQRDSDKMSPRTLMKVYGLRKSVRRVSQIIGAIGARFASNDYFAQHRT
jgi:hypothetical protein